MNDMVHDFPPDADQVLDEPPHSAEAEQAILGCLLYDNSVLARVRSFLRTEQFYLPIHGRLYSAMLGAFDRGEAFDAITMKARFSQDELMRELNGMDGAEYLGLLLIQASPVSTAGEYARLITDMAARRNGLAFMDQAKAELSDPNGEPAGSVLRMAAQTLKDLSAGAHGKVVTIDPADALDSFLSQQTPPRIMTGLAALDRVSRLEKGALTVLAGKTSMGKSAVAVDIARRVACGGSKVYFVSLEMAAAQIAARMVSAQMASITDPRGQATIGFPYVNIMRHHELNGDAIGMIRKEMARLPKLRVDAERSRMTASEIIARASDGDAPDLLVVDYLSKVSFDDMGRELRHDQRIGQAVYRLQDFAKETGCAVLLLVQLKRNGADEETRVPSLDDLRDSGEIEQAADAVWFVHRPAYFLERKQHRLRANGESLDRDDAEHLENIRRDLSIVIAKQRMGAIGTAHMRADIAHNHFYEGPNA